MKTMWSGVLIAGGLLGMFACGVDDAPGSDEPATAVQRSVESDAEGGVTQALEGTATPATMQIPPELALQQVTGGAATNLNGCGTLVFCADPRFTPHLPSFCTRRTAGCTDDKAFSDAIALCKSTCAPTSICSGEYYVLGPC